jgi:hypothetical protein
MTAYVSKIQMEVENLNRPFYNYLIAGGNAQAIANKLDLPKKTVLDQMSVVNGYHKIGARVWGC